MSNNPDEHNHLFVISSPSGGGKSTIIKRVLELRPDIKYSVSATSRAMRDGEIDGISYIFLSVSEFEKMISQDAFVEYESVHNNYYGTPRKQVDEALSKPVSILFDLDVYGAEKLKKLYPRAILIFLMPPSVEVLRARLTTRNSESNEEIERRLQRGKIKMEKSGNYDFHVLNDNLDTAVDRVVKIIDDIRQKSGKN